MSRKMKDSGIPWIGEIPEHWDINLLSSLFYEHYIKNKGLQEDNLLSLSYGKIKRKDINENGGLLPASFESYNIISPDDIVFRLTDLQNDKRSLRTGLCKEKGIITSAYVTIRQRHEKSCARFFHYLLHSYDECKVFYGIGNGVRQGMNFQDLRKLLLVSPSVSEQTLIADYLDKKCAEIDKLIGLQDRMIEKLTTYKQSVITEAVTKGLYPNVRMKDSGVEWIGEIPEHWEIKKLKYYCSDRRYKADNTDGYIGLENVVSYSAQFIETESEYDYSQSLLCKTNDVIFGKLRPYLAKVLLIEKECCCSNEFVVFSEIPVPNYLKYFLLSDYFIKIVDSSTYGTKMPRADIGFIQNMYICVPSLSEQQSIADYLDKKCAEIDRMIEIKKEKIEKLKTYKKSIIFEYVTGKKEVHHA